MIINYRVVNGLKSYPILINDVVKDKVGIQYVYEML